MSINVCVKIVPITQNVLKGCQKRIKAVQEKQIPFQNALYLS